MKRTLLIGLAFCFATVAQAQSLSGKWYGESMQKGISCWMDEFKSDNTYKTTFIGYDKTGRPTKHVEEGTWFLGNGYYVTLTHKDSGKNIDINNRNYHYVYQVISISDTKFVYQIGRLRFTATKMPDSFGLGDVCPELKSS